MFPVDWEKEITIAKVREYTDFLTQNDRTPKYIADEVQCQYAGF